MTDIKFHIDTDLILKVDTNLDNNPGNYPWGLFTCDGLSIVLTYNDIMLVDDNRNIISLLHSVEPMPKASLMAIVGGITVSITLTQDLLILNIAHKYVTTFHLSRCSILNDGVIGIAGTSHAGAIANPIHIFTKLTELIANIIRVDLPVANVGIPTTIRASITEQPTLA